MVEVGLAQRSYVVEEELPPPPPHAGAGRPIKRSKSSLLYKQAPVPLVMPSQDHWLSDFKYMESMHGNSEEKIWIYSQLGYRQIYIWQVWIRASPLRSYIRFIVQINQIGHHAIGGKILPFVFGWDLGLAARWFFSGSLVLLLPNLYHPSVPLLHQLPNAGVPLLFNLFISDSIVGELFICVKIAQLVFVL